jgi:hypothetical protein
MKQFRVFVRNDARKFEECEIIRVGLTGEFGEVVER